MTDKEKIRAEIERRITMNPYIKYARVFRQLYDACLPCGSRPTKIAQSWTGSDGKEYARSNGISALAGEPETLYENMDSVVEEKSEIPTELEEEVNRYWNNHALEYRLGRVADIDFLHLTARHFAEWQKKQDEETIELAEDHAMMAGRIKAKEEFDKKCQGCFDRDEVFRKGVLRGAKEQKKQDELEFCYEEAFDNGVKYTKEQMMKDAITADIDDFGFKMYEYCVEKLGLTSEDKVKLYIFKDDGKA